MPKYFAKLFPFLLCLVPAVCNYTPLTQRGDVERLPYETNCIRASLTLSQCCKSVHSVIMWIESQIYGIVKLCEIK